jgi:arginine decarboxylase
MKRSAAAPTLTRLSSKPAQVHQGGALEKRGRAHLCLRRNQTSRHLPNDILRELHGFIHMFEDTPEFVARHIIREAKSYLEGIQPPFFKALAGLRRGRVLQLALPRSLGRRRVPEKPCGQMFHQFFGENMLRADVCNAVEELGQLLDHNGAIGASERNAARIFNADHCFFVTNGTSTSEQDGVAPHGGSDDVVVVDRNCHKSILHSIIMTGAMPVFLKPTRNHLGHHRPHSAKRVHARGHQGARSAPTRCWPGVDPIR